MAAILRIKDANGVWHEIPAIKGSPGVSGVHIGQDVPPDGVNVWLYPDGDVSPVEEWEFDLEDGTTEERLMVQHGSTILRVRQEDGAWVEVPALKGSPGDPGKPFEYGDFTPEQLESLRGPKGDPYVLTDGDRLGIAAQAADMIAYVQPDNPPEDAPENSLWIDTDEETVSILRAEGVGF